MGGLFILDIFDSGLISLASYFMFTALRELWGNGFGSFCLPCGVIRKPINITYTNYKHISIILMTDSSAETLAISSGKYRPIMTYR